MGKGCRCFVFLSLSAPKSGKREGCTVICGGKNVGKGAVRSSWLVGFGRD